MTRIEHQSTVRPLPHNLQGGEMQNRRSPYSKLPEDRIKENKPLLLGILRLFASEW